MNYLYLCIECSEKEEPDFNWMNEKSAIDHLRLNGESHRLFIKAQVREFEIKVVDYEP